MVCGLLSCAPLKIHDCHHKALRHTEKSPFLEGNILWDSMDELGTVEMCSAMGKYMLELVHMLQEWGSVKGHEEQRH